MTTLTPAPASFLCFSRGQSQSHINKMGRTKGLDSQKAVSAAHERQLACVGQRQVLRHHQVKSQMAQLCGSHQIQRSKVLGFQLLLR